MYGQRKRELFNSKEEALEAAKKTGSDLGKPDFGSAGITGWAAGLRTGAGNCHSERIPDVWLHGLADEAILSRRWRGWAHGLMVADDRKAPGAGQ